MRPGLALVSGALVNNHTMKAKPDSSPPFMVLVIAVFFILTQCSQPGKTAKDVDWDLVDKLIEHRY